MHHGRAHYGEHFGICVAGYPEAHPDVIVDDPEKMKENYWKDVHYLKEKVRPPFPPPWPPVRLVAAGWLLD